MQNKIKKNFRTIILGQLIYLKKESKQHKFGQYYKTKHWEIILSDFMVSFKNNYKLHKIKFDEVKEIHLKDGNTFIFKFKDNRKKIMINLV